MLALVFSLTACGGDDDDDGGGNVDPPASVARGLSVVVQNASNGEAIDGAAVVVTQGPAELKGDSFVTGPLGNLEIPVSVPDDGSSVRVTLGASKEGFVPSSVTIALTQNSDDAVASLLLIQQSSTGAPTGVTVETTATSSTAIEGAGLTIDSSSGGSGSQVTIPAGTQLRDRDGTALSGNVTATVVHFDNTSDDALQAFPGGFAVQITNPEEVNVNGIDGAISNNEVTFETAGFTAIEIQDESGRTAKQLGAGQSYTLRIDIPAGTNNPQTRLPVQVGDSIPVWSFDNNVGQWQFEGTGVVASDVNGFFVEFTSDHFSVWSLAWYYSSTCTATINVNREGGGAESRSLKTRAKFSTGGGYLVPGQYSGDGTITLFDVPRGRDLDLQFNDPVTGEVVSITSSTAGTVGGDGKLTSVLVCPTGTSDDPAPFSVELEAPAANTANLTVTVQAVCQAPLVGGPQNLSAHVYLYSGLNQLIGKITTETGIASFPGLVAESTGYRVLVSNGELTRDTSITLFGDQGVTIKFSDDWDFCQQPTGGAGGSES
jgi:hypothetical protein